MEVDGGKAWGKTGEGGQRECDGSQAGERERSAGGGGDVGCEAAYVGGGKGRDEWHPTETVEEAADGE